MSDALENVIIQEGGAADNALLGMMQGATGGRRRRRTRRTRTATTPQNPKTPN